MYELLNCITCRISSWNIVGTSKTWMEMWGIAVKRTGWRKYSIVFLMILVIRESANSPWSNPGSGGKKAGGGGGQCFSNTFWGAHLRHWIGIPCCIVHKESNTNSNWIMMWRGNSMFEVVSGFTSWHLQHDIHQCERAATGNMPYSGIVFYIPLWKSISL